MRRRRYAVGRALDEWSVEVAGSFTDRFTVSKDIDQTANVNIKDLSCKVKAKAKIQAQTREAKAWDYDLNWYRPKAVLFWNWEGNRGPGRK